STSRYANGVSVTDGPVRCGTSGSRKLTIMRPGRGLSYSYHLIPRRLTGVSWTGWGRPFRSIMRLVLTRPLSPTSRVTTSARSAAHAEPRLARWPRSLTRMWAHPQRGHGRPDSYAGGRG